jgi:hypothetical protein
MSAGLKHYNFPSKQIAQVSDDAEAQMIMLQLGILDSVSSKKNSSDTTSLCVAENHPSHWCLCARIWGNADPSENGFMVIAYPKSNFDLMSVHVLAQQYLAHSTRLEITPLLPKQHLN